MTKNKTIEFCPECNSLLSIFKSTETITKNGRLIHRTVPSHYYNLTRKDAKTFILFCRCGWEESREEYFKRINRKNNESK